MDSVTEAEKQIVEILKELERKEKVLVRTIELRETNTYSVINRRDIPSMQVVISTEPLEREWVQ
jgi:hypothetical protein